MKVAYQGEPGAYSEQALRMYLPEAEAKPYPDFATAVAAVEDGRAEAAFLPLENTLVGPVKGVMDAVAGSDLRPRGSFDLNIEHCLVAHPAVGLDDLTTVHSHAAAIAQCQGFLRRRGLSTVDAWDTAGAVREVRERGDRSEAAIGSALAAERNGMQVLAKGIQDPGVNRTRFVLWRPA